MNPERHLKLTLSACGRSPNPPQIGHSFGPAAAAMRAFLVLGLAALVFQRIEQRLPGEGEGEGRGGGGVD